MKGKVERPWVCLLALTVIVCVAASMPVLASHTATSSEHTTDTDFNNAQTLDNLDVVGSDTGASVDITDVTHSDSVGTGGNSGNTVGVSDKRGIKVQTGDKALSNIEIAFTHGTNTNDEVTTAYILDSSGTQIESTSVGSNTASFSSTLDPNTEYYLVMDAGGSNYDSGWESRSGTISGDKLTFQTGATSGTTDDTDRWWMITDVDYEFEDTADSAQYVGDVHEAENVEEAFVDVDLSGGAEVAVTWEGRNSGSTSWNEVTTATYTSSGEFTEPVSGGYDEWRLTADFTGGVDTDGSLTTEGVRSSTSPPELDNSSASPNGENVTSSPVTLQIDVSDADFGTTQGDTVEIEWYHNGTLVGTTTHTQNETASIESNEGVGGTNEWYAVATDGDGHETTSQTFTFESPSELEIRDVHTGELINSSEVQVQFYHSGDVVVEETTTDGKVDLGDIDADTEILVDADADDYYPRSIIIESIWEQQKIYLLNSTDADVDAVQPRFRLNDPSGQFVESESDLFIERPLNYSGSGSEWVVVAGDEFGAEGYTVWLEEGVRYRLVLRNEAGDRRTVGSYRPTATETIELTVEGIEYGFQLEEANVEYSIEYDDDVQEVQFAYKDHEAVTETLNLEIYEQGDKSNTIANKSWSPGNDITFAVPANNTTNWVVEFDADRGTDHQDVSEVRVVGQTHLDIGPDLDPRWSTVAGMGMLVVVGGLFGRGRPEIGAIAVSVLGGILWLIGWMPGATTGAMVVVALFVSILYYARGGGAR